MFFFFLNASWILTENTNHICKLLNHMGTKLVLDFEDQKLKANIKRKFISQELTLGDSSSAK